MRTRVYHRLVVATEADSVPKVGASGIPGVQFAFYSPGDTSRERKSRVVHLALPRCSSVPSLCPLIIYRAVSQAVNPSGRKTKVI